MNKNLLQATTLLFLLCGNFLFSQSNLELAKIAGDSNPIVSGPTKSAQTVFFLKNTTGTTLGLYNTTPLSATFEVTNEQYAFTAPENQSSINFGKALAEGGRVLYAPLNVFGASNNSGSTTDSWASDTVSGDGIVISLSTLESDIQVTNAVNNTQPTLGQDVIFTVVAKNNGPSANTGIEVQNKLPARYQYVSKVVPTGTTYDETTGIWDIGSLIDGASATLIITAKVLFAGTSTSQATISSTGGISDPDPKNNIASVTNACVVEQGNASFNVPATEGAKNFTVTRPLPNKGFVVDITILDNSFNLSVNGTLLLPTEVQFQSASTTGINVEFVDGTQYEVGTGVAGSRSIFQMTGTVSAPLVRVVVSDTGAVTLFGSKVSGGPLFPLRLKGTATFNTIPVNNNNNVVITQIGTGPTGITGSIYGINSTTCVCYNDANFSVGTPAATQHGITLLKRAGADNGNWPMNRNSAFTALESNTRGFVITRLATAALGNITAPQDGMMVYDTTADCLKIYDGTGWKCFSVPTCP